ncbi:MAG: plasmid pRiA4b ORF-3 family protein [Leptolyngbya sp. SIO4C1]|nr:plasmid pRiA4b ORF-3 family protein [Leptolyngbya sp. SIO4C1]
MMSDSKIYQLKVAIIDSEPLIWRRVLVPAELTLEELHRVLQVAMGWQNIATYHYRVGKRRSDMEPALLKMPLNEVVRDDLTTFSYLYDPRDGWLHSIHLEMVLPADPNGVYPHCVTGEKACPPEGCGGIWGYDELLELLEDPHNPESAARLEELAPEFEPGAFDVDLVNMQLHN